jgi:hypothetical protein
MTLADLIRCGEPYQNRNRCKSAGGNDCNVSEDCSATERACAE